MSVELLVADAPAIALAQRASGGRSVEHSRQRVELAGTLIDQIDFAGALDRIAGFLESAFCHQVVTVNLDFLSIAARAPAFREAINRSDLAVADGMPVVWASRMKGQPLPQRITGNELVAECCQMAADTAHGIFLLGAAEGVAEAAGRALRDRYPGLRIVGTYSPPYGPLTSEDNQRIVETINATKPGFLFVALGAPRQDLWIQQHLHLLDTRVAMGIGCVLDLLAGNVRRAPQWMQRVGLEWSYRLAQEPQRLWRRYIIDDIPMLGQLVWEAVHQPGQGLSLVQSAIGNPRA
jgi:N-acetylglucosaminyldiphosphoundecaprenol N-acetyl-beta-D-mannosaminyltransferase